MLQWDNLVPIAYKKSSVASLVNRPVRVCSCYHLLHNAFKYIHIMAHFNSYPLSFVARIIARVLEKLTASAQIQNANSEIAKKQKKYQYE